MGSSAFDFLNRNAQQASAPAPMMPAPASAPAAPQAPMNPMMMRQQVMSKMNNPWAFLKEKWPDIPDEYANNPVMIMQYIQRTRNVSNQDIQNLANFIPANFRR
jgi:hypothetical protein